MPVDLHARLSQDCGLSDTDLLIAAVSGGPDSLCLLHLMHQAGLRLVAAHFDHQLRPDSGADARWVGESVRSLGIECVIGGGDVRGHARRSGLTIEEAARDLRYRFLFDLARARIAQAVVTGHTADDQVETILLHLLRGSGLAGLTGMSVRTLIAEFDPRIPLLRPLLSMRRAETVAFCAEHGLQPRHDPGNDSLEFQRNRIRHTLLPLLETFNPQVREALLRTASTLRDDQSVLDDLVGETWRRALLEESAAFICLDAVVFLAAPIGLRRRLIRRAVLALQPDADPDFAALERAARLVDDPAPSARVELRSGLFLLHEEDRLYVHSDQASLPAGPWPSMGMDPLPVPVPGRLELPGGWTLVSEILPSDATLRSIRSSDPFQAWFDADDLRLLRLRVPRPGDRIMPLGMNGSSQKLSDLFVNQKVPRRARSSWPLLCADEDILWAAGLRSSHPARVQAGTKQVLHCKLIRDP